MNYDIITSADIAKAIMTIKEDKGIAYTSAQEALNYLRKLLGIKSNPLNSKSSYIVSKRTGTTIRLIGGPRGRIMLKILEAQQTS